jgi:CHAT domain-containing protein
LKEIQSELLDEDTLLVEYALGEQKSFVWVVTPTAISSFELPARAPVEAAARRVYDVVTANHPADQRSGQDTEYRSAALALSRMLLEPIAAQLKNKRLLIVSEGVLQYVPFAALPEPGSQPNVPTPLVVQHDIVSLPSASVLGVLRRETRERAAPAKTVAVFADPVFDSSDARIALAKRGLSEDREKPVSGEVKRSADDLGLESFPRLRFSRQEAEQIVRLASSEKSVAVLDFAANRTAATNPDLDQYRIVHFATHGLINNEHVELSGIVLSLVNQQGQPQNGFLRLYDIYNMNLKAELVVLSACKTALGKDIKGEGLVGLTRAFMYAGSKRVVASLWQTEDRATAALMERFYEGLLQKGLSPAAALRSAQISMWKDNRWAQPRYWAAFTLQGEWK